MFAICIVTASMKLFQNPILKGPTRPLRTAAFQSGQHFVSPIENKFFLKITQTNSLIVEDVAWCFEKVVL
jgi:hypothetical protein